MEFPVCNIYGREYARLSQVKAGDAVEIDDGFDCMRCGAVLTVEQDEDGGLYVLCDGSADDDDPRDLHDGRTLGRHYIDGQADDGEHVVGMYPVRG